MILAWAGRYMDHHPARTSEWPLIAKLVLASSFLFHSATLPLFIIAVAPRGLYHESPYAYYFYVVLSLALASVSFLVRRRLHFRVLLLVRVGLLLLFCAPFGRYLDIRLLLIITLTLEASIFEGFPTNLICSILLLLGSLFLTVPALLAGEDPGQIVDDITGYVLCAGLVAVLSCTMTYYREEMVHYGRETVKLSSAVEELTRAQTGYLELARDAEERSTYAERNRLSAELHDSLGYTFTNLMMMLEAAKELIERDPARLRDLVNTGLGLVRQGMQDTRKTLYLLRERQELKPPFLTAVARLIEVFKRATGVDVKVEYTNFPFETEERVESAVYHFIQEGIVNSFTHGKANRISIIFWCDEEKLQVSIQDNGVGVNTIIEGIGIRGMRERLGRLGGTLVMHNTQDGFHILARIPTREQEWRS
jgi:signal transduction histidine kinase